MLWFLVSLCSIGAATQALRRNESAWPLIGSAATHRRGDPWSVADRGARSTSRRRGGAASGIDSYFLILNDPSSKRSR